jgi:hypothetical protein
VGLRKIRSSADITVAPERRTALADAHGEVSKIDRWWGRWPKMICRNTTLADVPANVFFAW